MYVEVLLCVRYDVRVGYIELNKGEKFLFLWSFEFGGVDGRRIKLT